MGLFSAVTKFGLAKKAFDTARRPENQARIKGAVASLNKRRKSS